MPETMPNPDAGLVERPLGRPMIDDGSPAWRQIERLFERHGLKAPSSRLRDELVMLFTWAQYGFTSREAASRIARAREALEPFANAAQYVEDVCAENYCPVPRDEAKAWVSGWERGRSYPMFTYGDLRRARQALSEQAGASTTLDHVVGVGKMPFGCRDDLADELEGVHSELTDARQRATLERVMRALRVAAASDQFAESAKCSAGASEPASTPVLEALIARLRTEIADIEDRISGTSERARGVGETVPVNEKRRAEIATRKAEIEALTALSRPTASASGQGGA